MSTTAVRPRSPTTSDVSALAASSGALEGRRAASKAIRRLPLGSRASAIAAGDHRYALAMPSAAASSSGSSWLIFALIAPGALSSRPRDVTQRLLPPSATHWLGTDTLGRDVLSRLFYGARISLFVGIVVVLLGALFGTLVGGIAAYAGGWARWR